jgi:hypothetical protein
VTRGRGRSRRERGPGRRNRVSAATAFLLPAAALFLLAASARAEVSRDLTSLPYRRVVHLAAHVPAGYWLAMVEDSLLAARSAPDFHDVRLMNGAGESVPFAVLPPRREDPVDIAVMASPLPAQYSSDTFLQVDLGPDYPESILVELPRRSGQGPVVIRTGPQRERTVRLEPIPGAHPRTHPTGQAPPEPGVDRRFGIAAGRYLQVDFQSTGNFLPGDSLRVYRRVERAAPRLSVPFRIVSRGFEGRTWRAVVELESPAGAATAIAIKRRTVLARPPVRVDARLPRGGWRYVSVLGDEASAPRGDSAGSLEFPPVRTDALRLTVGAADPRNAPLTVEGVQTVPTRWAFPASAAAGTLWVAYGDPYLGAQDWFLEDTAERVPGFAPVTLGPETANPLFRPPGFGLNWLRRHPPVLGAATVIVLALVALLVFRARSEAEA